MLNKGKWVHLLLVLTVALSLVGNLTIQEAEAKGGFSDIGDVTWARQAIAEMNAIEIIKGYPEGVFRPYQNVNRLEAVAMLVRVLDLEEQANARENAVVDYKMPTDLGWGKGYLVVAVQQGILNEGQLNQFQPDSPATRVEVAVLIANALKLTPNGGGLAFADSGEISVENRDAVIAVVGKNIMQGFPGNVFKPKDEVNRAQMAVLLSRLVEKGLANPHPERRVSGIISSVNPTSRLIIMNPGGSKSFSPDCEVFLEGNGVEPEQLKTYDKVSLVLNKSSEAVFISAKRVSGSWEYIGKVESLKKKDSGSSLTITNLEGKKDTYSVAEGVNPTWFGDIAETSLNLPGNFVKIGLQGNTITEIDVIPESMIKGTVVLLRPASLTICEEKGTKTELYVPAGVQVLKDNSKKKYEDIREGNLVTVSVYENMALIVRILDSSDTEGIIIDYQAGSKITILGDDAEKHNYKVKTGVDVWEDGSMIDFEALDIGERVVLEMDSDDYVGEIKVVQEEKTAYPEGDIESIDKDRIIIKDDQQNKKEFTVTRDAVFIKEGSVVKFTDLDHTDRVRLLVDGMNSTNRIEVVDKDGSVITGTISELDTFEDDPEITVRKTAGYHYHYEIIKDAKITRGGSKLSLKQLLIGSEVKLYLKYGKVVNIKVTGEKNIWVPGEVVSITAKSGKITIQQSTGSKFSYDFRENASLIDKDGLSIKLADVKKGWNVILELKEGFVRSLIQK